MTGAVRAWLEERAGVYREYLSAVVLNGQASAESTGLHTTDVYALNVLQAAGPMTAGRLAETVGLSSGATTRLVDRLEGLGYVRRESDAGDRRTVTVSVTPESVAHMRRVFEPTRDRLGELLQGYTVEQLDVLFDYFDRAAPLLREAAAATRGKRPKA